MISVQVWFFFFFFDDANFLTLIVQRCADSLNQALTCYADQWGASGFADVLQVRFLAPNFSVPGQQESPSMVRHSIFTIKKKKKKHLFLRIVLRSFNFSKSLLDTGAAEVYSFVQRWCVSSSIILKSPPPPPAPTPHPHHPHH